MLGAKSGSATGSKALVKLGRPFDSLLSILDPDAEHCKNVVDIYVAFHCVMITAIVLTAFGGGKDGFVMSGLGRLESLVEYSSTALTSEQWEK